MHSLFSFLTQRREGAKAQRFLRLVAAVAFFSLPAIPARAADSLPPEVRQLVVSVAPEWGSIHGRLLALDRMPDGSWKTALGPIPVLFGQKGLVWGLGVLGSKEPGTHKVERDAKAPAGVFKIGTIYTYERALPAGADYPFHTVTAADAWVDSPALPELYNRFVSVNLASPPAWFESQKMRHNDEAYRYLIEIRHNADPPVVGAGSAIFFHTRRGPERPTWGCTTMAREDLVELMRWLRAGEHPHYALLPWSEYQRKWAKWGLPSPETVRAIAP